MLLGFPGLSGVLSRATVGCPELTLPSLASSGPSRAPGRSCRLDFSCGGGFVHAKGFSPKKSLGADGSPQHHPLPLSLPPPTCRQALARPPRHLEPRRALGLRGEGAAAHRARGTISLQKKGFQATPRLWDKKPSVRPSVPSPAFANNIPLCRAPPPRPPATHCGLSATLWRLVCLRCRAQTFRCSSLFPAPGALQANPLRGRQGLGPGGGWGLRRSPGRGLGTPRESPRRERAGAWSISPGTAVDAGSCRALPGSI